MRSKGRQALTPQRDPRHNFLSTPALPAFAEGNWEMVPFWTVLSCQRPALYWQM